MQGWRSTYLGLREVPRELSEFELQAFFTFSAAELAVIQRRRGPTLKLGLALHLGFTRMSGRPLDAFRVLPTALLRHLGKQLGIPVPDVASLRALYQRRRTLFEHQDLACRILGLTPMTEHQRRALLRALKDEASRSADRERLLSHARRWLYEHQVLLVHDRPLRALVSTALVEVEAETAAALREAVPSALWQRWLEAMSGTRDDGQPMQSWLWASPARHSTRQISEMFERIEFLRDLGVDRALTDLDALLVRRYARRRAARAPSASAKIKESARAVEVACFLRHCLVTATDQWILMVQRRVVDVWRHCASGVPANVDWAARYRGLLESVTRLSVDGSVSESVLRTALAELVVTERRERRPSRASVIRERLMDGIRAVRSLLGPITGLHWQAKAEHPVLQGLDQLRSLYALGQHTLPAGIGADAFGRVWSVEIGSADRERAAGRETRRRGPATTGERSGAAPPLASAFRAFEVATLFAWRRAVRNGSVWLEHSLSFRGRERLFLAPVLQVPSFFGGGFHPLNSGGRLVQKLFE